MSPDAQVHFRLLCSLDKKSIGRALAIAIESIFTDVSQTLDRCHPTWESKFDFFSQKTMDAHLAVAPINRQEPAYRGLDHANQSAQGAQGSHLQTIIHKQRVHCTICKKYSQTFCNSSTIAGAYSKHLRYTYCPDKLMTFPERLLGSDHVAFRAFCAAVWTTTGLGEIPCSRDDLYAFVDYCEHPTDELMQRFQARCEECDKGFLTRDQVKKHAKTRKNPIPALRA